MHEVKIESIEDYTMYIKKESMQHFKDERLQEGFQKACLQSFMDGIKFTQKRLEVKIK